MFDSTEVKWKDLSLYIDGVKVGKFTELFYDSEQEADEIYGEEDEPLDIQTGNRKYFGTMKLYKSVIDKLNASARAKGHRDLMDVPLLIVAAYKTTLASPKTTDTLPNVRVTNYRRGMEQNAKSMPVSLSFKCLRPETL